MAARRPSTIFSRSVRSSLSLKPVAHSDGKSKAERRNLVESYHKGRYYCAMRIKVMADYGCWPLWHDDGGEVGNIDPNTLPLSEGLVSALMSWATRLDDALNSDDPGNTQWPDGFRENFNREGRKLTERLRNELGSAYEVSEKLFTE